MELSEFTTTLPGDQPPPLSRPLQALWYEANDDWDLAHQIVQRIENQKAYWVHAYLHRVEGDLSNARYWYSRAGKAPVSGELKDEWMLIAKTLLAELDQGPI